MNKRKRIFPSREELHRNDPGILTIADFSTEYPNLHRDIPLTVVEKRERARILGKRGNRGYE